MPRIALSQQTFAVFLNSPRNSTANLALLCPPLSLHRPILQINTRDEQPLKIRRSLHLHHTLYPVKSAHLRHALERKHTGASVTSHLHPLSPRDLQLDPRLTQLQDRGTRSWMIHFSMVGYAAQVIISVSNTRDQLREGNAGLPTI